MEPVTIKLTTPIEDIKGNQVTELVVNSPTGRDWTVVGGRPFSINGDESLSFDAGKMLKYAERCAGHPANIIESLSFQDRGVLEDTIMGFFGGSSQDS